MASRFLRNEEEMENLRLTDPNVSNLANYRDYNSQHQSSMEHNYDAMSEIERLKAELMEARKQIKELKLDLVAKSMEKSDHTKEQFWKLVVRHEHDLVNFDEEKIKMIQREADLVSEINNLKGELKARGEFKILQPVPDSSLKYELELLQSHYEKLQLDYNNLKKNYER